MCNRESFVLFPEQTGIPVAWGVSYHHEEILRASFPDYKMRREILGRGFYVQIECVGGDVRRWDWDNTPLKNVRVVSGSAQWQSTSVTAEVRMFSEPDIPLWLEDNLRSYQNRIESILEQLNPWRNRWDVLQQWLRGMVGTDRDIPVDEFLRYAHPDSAPVREFEQIVNAYRQIPGFVEGREQNKIPVYFQKW